MKLTFKRSDKIPTYPPLTKWSQLTPGQLYYVFNSDDPAEALFTDKRDFRLCIVDDLNMKSLVRIDTGRTVIEEAHNEGEDTLNMQMTYVLIPSGAVTASLDD